MILPPPRRRSPLALPAPRDATETARQGQGIGDLEAMRQMAATSVPEMLRMAPVTGEAMSVFDAAWAAANRDYPGAGMALAGALPVAGTVKRAGKAVQRAIDLAEAQRVARGKELFPMEVFHGTSSPEGLQAFEARQPPTGQLHDLPGVHVGTREAANERIGHNWGDTPAAFAKALADEAKEAKRAGVQPQRPSVLPLRMRMEKPYLQASGEPFTEGQLRLQVKKLGQERKLFPQLGGPMPKNYWENVQQARQLMADKLLAEGHDVVPYINTVEDPGSVSYLVLDPSRLRSMFAQFDPQKLRSRDLSAGLAGIFGAGAAATMNRPEREQ